MTVESLGPRARRFEYLDLVRLLCAATVVIFHYVVVSPYTKVIPTRFSFLPDILVYGQFGVHVFFMISGFVITLSARNRSSVAFAWARFLRLYPAYWICCGLTALILTIFGTGLPTLWKPDLTQFLVNLTMLEGFVGIPYVDGVYWSLTVELRFYLVVALCLIVRLRVDALPVMGGWIAACFLAPYLPAAVGKPLMTPLAPYFLVGMLIQRMTDGRSTAVKIGLLLATFVLIRQEIFASHVVHQSRNFMLYDPAIAFAVVVAGALLVLGCAFAPSPRRLAPLMVTIGAATYPLYLIHESTGVTILAYLAPFVPPVVAVAVAVSVVTILTLLISTYAEPFVRGQLRQLGERVGPRIAPLVPRHFRTTA